LKNRTRIEDVAKLAGVSTATVSRSLSHPHRVRLDTRQAVQQAIAHLGYMPDAAGRALASGRTKTVGCLIPTLDHAIFASSTHALQIALAESGYQLLVASHNYNPEQELALADALMQRGVDALVLVGSHHHPQLWKMILDWRKPALLTWACDPRLPSIGFDNHAIAAMAAQHLLDLGHKRIGMISGYTKHNDRAEARVTGLRDTMARAGLSLAGHALSEQALNIQGGRLGLIDLLKAKVPPTAILCGNDLLATGALLEAQRQGINVPQDLSICGIDNHELASEMNPGLTTVSLPTQDLGRLAAAHILSALAGEPTSPQTLLPFELMVRGTTAKAN
jgi:LacI family transcriptional regulator